MKQKLKEAIDQLEQLIELYRLEKIVGNFEELDEDARYRSMKYFTSRFSKYVPRQQLGKT